ncbi:MAG: hypothetical protein ACOYI3_04395 [Christensenellales bacterium]|jgi:hypothetical protein
MKRYDFSQPLNADAELEDLLKQSGVDYRKTGGRFSFLFSNKGCKWQTVCDCVGERVLIYGIHPTPVRDEASALAACSEINRKAVAGGCFLSEGRLIFRTSAELFEPCAAAEALTRALEYNAAVMSAFWETMAQGAAGSHQHSPFTREPRFGDKRKSN